MSTITATRRAGFSHDVEIGGHSLVVDEPEAGGGADAGPSPTRLLAAALASCTAITVEMYADRKGWELGELSVRVDVSGDVTKGEAAYAVALDLPPGLESEQIDRIARIAARCPVHRVMQGETKITISTSVEAGGA